VTGASSQGQAKHDAAQAAKNTSTTTIVQPATSAPPVAEAPVPATPVPATPPSGNLRFCDQNIQADAQTTTCPLAENTFVAYWNSGNSSSGWGNTTVSAYSPKTGQNYDMTCSTDQTTVWCSGTAGSSTLSVQFPMQAVQMY
jgi:hypothetical protein